jgi:tetratricopeptide (TPR) repeat protein
MKTKISVPRKLFLVGFGVLCCFFLIEISLRFGGMFFLSAQQYRNQFSIKQNGSYRILCLGESTTANQYPALLETELNKRDTGVRFTVIDKGIPGRHTSDILDALESNLNEYRPDMVITMMGINDLGSHMPYEAVSDSQAVNFLRSLRTYKLARFLWLRIVNKSHEVMSGRLGRDTVRLKPFYAANEPRQVSARGKGSGSRNYWLDIGLGQSYRDQGRVSEAKASFKNNQETGAGENRDNFKLGWFLERQGRYSEAEAAFSKAIEADRRDDRAYIGLGQLYRNQGRLSAAEALFAKAIEIDPRNDWVYFELGWVYERQGRCPEAEAAFKKAIAVNPKNDWAYMGLGWVYRVLGEFSDAGTLFQKAIEVNPRNDWAYVGLGQSCREQGKFLEAEAAFRKAIEINPGNNRAYFELGWIFHEQGVYSESEELFQRAVEADPRNDWAYVGLGQSCREQGKFSEAEAAFKKALELDPRNDWACGTLKVLYIEMGDPGLGREYDKRIDGSRPDYYPRIVIENYHKLKAALDKRGIVYVCAQYPLRSLKPLKKIFRDSAGNIIFVDNQEVFREALKKNGYNAYFIDMTGGDFGHCTPEGNRLLAENIADVILDKVFSARIINAAKGRERH